MKISDEGIKLIQNFEGCRLTSYKCPANIVTIGYGHTGSDVALGMTITMDKAIELLHKDLERFEKGVENLVKVGLQQNQFDALVSFAYNCGLSALQNSTLLKKLNKGNYKSASDEFLKWNKAGGRVLNGLTKRRKAERAMFISKVNIDHSLSELPYNVRTTSKLNIRVLPGTHGSVIRTVDKGTILKVWAIQTINGVQWGKNGKEYFHLGYTERI